MVLTRQQRFARNVDGNINKGIGGYAFREKGYTFPSHEQMDKFDKYKIPHDVDPDLRDLVIDLNDSGYTTAGSCQHTGFVTIEPHRSEVPKSIPRQVVPHKFSPRKIDATGVKEIKHLHKEHGLKVTGYSPSNWVSTPTGKRTTEGEPIVTGIRNYHKFDFIYR